MEYQKPKIADLPVYQEQPFGFGTGFMLFSGQEGPAFLQGTILWDEVQTVCGGGIADFLFLMLFGRRKVFPDKAV